VGAAGAVGASVDTYGACRGNYWRASLYAQLSSLPHWNSP